MDLVSGFPKKSTLKQLSKYTKQTVKVIPDRTSVNFGEVSRFKQVQYLIFKPFLFFADVTLYNNQGATATNYSYHLRGAMV
jgi:hypothetical protein